MRFLVVVGSSGLDEIRNGQRLVTGMPEILFICLMDKHMIGQLEGADLSDIGHPVKVDSLACININP